MKDSVAVWTYGPQVLDLVYKIFAASRGNALYLMNMKVAATVSPYVSSKEKPHTKQEVANLVSVGLTYTFGV